jgi:hypothetical protein
MLPDEPGGVRTGEAIESLVLIVGGTSGDGKPEVVESDDP